MTKAETMVELLIANRKVDRHDTYVFEWKTKPTPFLFPVGPRSPPYLSSALAIVTNSRAGMGTS